MKIIIPTMSHSENNERMIHTHSTKLHTQAQTSPPTTNTTSAQVHTYTKKSHSWGSTLFTHSHNHTHSCNHGNYTSTHPHNQTQSKILQNTDTIKNPTKHRRTGVQNYESTHSRNQTQSHTKHTSTVGVHNDTSTHGSRNHKIHQ